MDLQIYIDNFCGVRHSSKSSFSDVLQLIHGSVKTWMPQSFDVMGCVQSLKNMCIFNSFIIWMFIRLQKCQLKYTEFVLPCTKHLL